MIKDLDEMRVFARQMFRGRVFQAEGTVSSRPRGSNELGMFEEQQDYRWGWREKGRAIEVGGDGEQLKKGPCRP